MTRFHWLLLSVFVWVCTATNPAQQEPGLIGIHDHYTEPLPFLDRIEAEGEIGWVTTSVAIGSNPADLGGENFNNVAGPPRNHRFVCRINNGYFPDGTLPVPAQYANFAQRCANFVQATANNMGADRTHFWLIGNETNLAIEWPNDGISNLVYISPANYADCFAQVYTAIKAVRPNDMVLVQPLAPYGGPYSSGTLWIYNHPGQPINWIDYQWQMLTEIANLGITPDGLAIHAGSRGYNPTTVFNEDGNARSNSPGLNLAFGSEAMREWIMFGTPPEFWDMPLYITETNGLYWWKGGGPETASDPAYQSGYMQALFGFIDDWNQGSRLSGMPVYHCANLYRWAAFDDWGIEGYNGNAATQAIYDNILADTQAVAGVHQRVPFPGLPMLRVDPRSASRENVAPGSAVLTDTVNASDVGSRAIDGNTATRWTSLSSLVPHTLALDLGTPQPVAGFRVLHAQAGGDLSTRNTRLFRIDTAPTASGPWSSVAVGNNRLSESVSEYSFTSSRPLQHVRLFITDSGADDFARILEFEVIADVAPMTQVIDNRDANCIIVTGDWTREMDVPSQYGNDHYSASAGSGESSVEWRPALVAGVYRVEVWLPESVDNVSDAHFAVHHRMGVADHTVSQQTGGDSWVTLGEYEFDGGNSGWVELTNDSQDTGKTVVADAVRFVALGPLPVSSGILGH